MSYTVLARKYRPQTFSDLVGQEHVTRALGNAIATGRVAHAFLFTGVRGVGKTTSARILAKALNCERGPTAEPCNVCDACVQITQGTDLDVLEIDGASNNSVEDVRRLQESIPFRPARGRFKIVIVDEVHMLSTGAFNAFLKTLEEPPAHVKFIFATTESHKVPVTIRSRCQRYDFRLIPQNVIIERVRQILAAEHIEADAEALTIVAREAAGSMRDALTLLDQVVAFSGDRLLGSEVAEKLGIADREHLYQLARAVLAGEGRSALEVIERVANQGLDLLHFTRQWLDLMRDVVVLQVAGDHPTLVELSAEERKRALELGQTAPSLELQRVFAGVAKLVDEVGKASSPRVMLEMGAVRLATRPKLDDLSTLIARVEELARSAPSAAPARAPSAGGSGGSAAPGRAPTPAPSHAPREASPAPQRPAPAVSPTRPASPQAPENPFQRYVPQDPREPPRSEQVHELPSAAPLSAPSAAAAVAVSTAKAPALAVASAERPALSRVETAPSTPPALATAPQATPDPAKEAAAHAHPEQWRAVVERMRALEPRWAAMYEHAVPQEVSAARVVVLFPEGSFFGRQAQTPAGTEALRRASSDVLSASPELQIRLASEVRGKSLAQKEAALMDERKEGIKKRALNHPRVLEAFKIFPELAQKQDVQVD